MDKTKTVEVKEEINLNLNDWSFKLQERKRNRMKLQIKLSKVEAQAFKNFAEVVKPDEISDADFLKSVFKIGLEEMENRLMSAVEKHAEENNIDLESLRKDAEYDTVEEMVRDAATSTDADANDTEDE